jgi:ribosomal protein L19E
LPGQDRGGEQPALIAPARPIASVPTGMPPGHLDDRQQAIHARQRLRFDRHAQHRQPRHRRRHAGQMGGTAGARHDDLQPAPERRAA